MPRIPELRVVSNAPERKSPEDISLIRGGPFYRAQTITHLIAPDRWNLRRRLVFALAVGWLPLVLVTLLFHPGHLMVLLGDYLVYSRMVIAVPVLIIGQLLMESRFRTIVTHTREANLLKGENRARFDEVIARIVRLRNSAIPELIIVLVVYVHIAMMWHGRVEMVAGSTMSWVVQRMGSTLYLTPAGWYYALVSQFLYQFLIGLTLWKWLLWSVFLFRLSRLPLDLFATHPDRRGGLGFLGLSPIGFAPLVFATTAAIGATWRYQILHNGAHLSDFKIPAIVLLFLILITALAPLVFFVPKLAALRRNGLSQYGTLGQLHSREFEDKWILNRSGHESEFLAAPEVSTLTDFAASYENIQGMKPFPGDKGSLIGLALAVALPLLPTVLAEIPLTTVLKDLLSALR